LLQHFVSRQKVAQGSARPAFLQVVLNRLGQRRGISAQPVQMRMDSLTGRPPLGLAVLVVTEGTYTESAQASLQVSNGTLIIAAAHERPGTYSLRVTMTGYQAWTASGVRVSESGRCDNVDTVKLTARLQPI
jgi:hypothetical protein